MYEVLFLLHPFAHCAILSLTKAYTLDHENMLVFLSITGLTS